MLFHGEWRLKRIYLCILKCKINVFVPYSTGAPNNLTVFRLDNSFSRDYSQKFFEISPGYPMRKTRNPSDDKLFLCTCVFQKGSLGYFTRKLNFQLNHHKMPVFILKGVNHVYVGRNPSGAKYLNQVRCNNIGFWRKSSARCERKTVLARLDFEHA